jgi:hypothetical protein
VLLLLDLQLVRREFDAFQKLLLQVKRLTCK